MVKRDISQNQQSEDVEVLRAVGAVLRDAPDLRTLVADLYDCLAAQLRVDRVSILLFEKNLQALVSDQFFGLEGPREEARPVSAPQKTNESISGQCFLRGAPIAIPDCETTNLIPRELVRSLGLKSTVALPLIPDGAPIGVLRLDDTTRTHRFSDADFPFLMQIADLIAPTLASHWGSTDTLQYQDAYRRAYDQIEQQYMSRTAELVQANVRLSASEERFRGVADNAHDAIISADARGRIIYFNPAAERILGFPRDEALRLTLSAFIPEHLQDSSRRGIKRFLPFAELQQSENSAASLKARRRNGTEVPVECSVSAWRAGTQCFFTGIVRDISERKRAEVITGVFAELGHSLSYLSTRREIAVAVLNAADTLFQWDSSYLDTLDEPLSGRHSVISFDSVDGERREVAGTPGSEVGPLALKALQEGAQLVLRPGDYKAKRDYLFGDVSRPSLSILLAPIGNGTANIGLLSIQSYATNAYEESDLELFATLADFCSGALERAAAEERLLRSKEALRRETAYARLLGITAMAANETNDLKEALKACLPEICTATDCQIGHALEVSTSSTAPHLISLNLWYCSLSAEEAASIQEQMEMAGIPERTQFPTTALEGEPVWNEDLSVDPFSTRAAVIRTAGLYGAIAVPVSLGIEVVAVLELFSQSRLSPSPRLIEVLKQVGVQLGRVVERSRAEARLTHNAFHDSLTSLPNRACLEERLGQCLMRARRHPEIRFAVLFLDLDRFKVINDSLGHRIGDLFLTTVARKLEQCVRQGDTVARLGGDEFALLLQDVESDSDATAVAERIAQELSQPILVGGHSVVVTASIGIVFSRPDGEGSAGDLLRDADAAMYRAKAQGKACYRVFDPSMHTHAIRRLEVEGELRLALERGEIIPYFQPVVSMITGRITGFEALARWRHPERGIVPPSEFIAIAEETGLIIPLGWHIMREACLWMAQIQAGLPPSEDLSISVNLAAQQLLQPDLVPRISAILEETGLSHRSLRLEITESSLIQHDAIIVDNLSQLRALDLHIQVDDFGTGYSSLSYLHRFPVDALKIDRSFVMALGDNAGSTEIVRAIVALARSLSLNVIAEGVETQAQIQTLRNLGCDLAQGFHYSRAVDSEQARVLAVQLGPLPHPIP